MVATVPSTLAKLLKNYSDLGNPMLPWLAPYFRFRAGVGPGIFQPASAPAFNLVALLQFQGPFIRLQSSPFHGVVKYPFQILLNPSPVVLWFPF